MKRALLMPKLGLTMTEGALVEWSVKAGESFAAEATLFVVETEKTATDVPAERSGVLVEIMVDAGVTVPVGTVLGHWDDGTGDEPGAGASEASGAAGKGEDAPAPSARAGMPPQASSTVSGPGARVKATPLARRVALQRGVDLAAVKGAGPGGRIRAADVESAAASYASTDSREPARGVGHEAARAMSVRAEVLHERPVVPTRAPPALRAPTPAQATIARRLAASKRDTPHFYLAVEAEVSRLVALRNELKSARPDLRYTLNHFVLAAVGRALADVPAINVVWTEEGLLHLTASDVGMAVATDRGLVAPVLRDVGHVTLSQVAQQAAVAAERARAGRLTAPELEGGAITVSNAGMHDVTYMTSIINPGQSLILGVGSVRELFRPDAAGKPALRREMGLVLSADHRVHDAVGALAFLKRVVAHLEQPVGLVL